MARPFLCLVLLAIAGCLRGPGSQPGEILFWRVVASEVTFTDCSDAPSFRDGIEPIPVNAYLIYRVEEDGERAPLLDCDTRNPSSCVDDPTGMTFQVAGTELFFSAQTKEEIGSSGCPLSA